VTAVSDKYQKLPPPDGPRHRADGADGTDPKDASLGELAAQLSAQVSHLVRSELALAQLEAKKRGKKMGMGAGLLVTSLLLGFFVLACGVTAAILALAMELRPWAAALAVAVGLIVLCTLLGLPGLLLLRSRKPAVPQDSVESLKADVSAVKAAMRRG
jgi:hypothetical protein